MDNYTCIDCNYETNILKYYKQHCNTIKHKNNIDKKENKSKILICEYCLKEYTIYNSLRYHVKNAR